MHRIKILRIFEELRQKVKTQQPGTNQGRNRKFYPYLVNSKLVACKLHEHQCNAINRL